MKKQIGHNRIFRIGGVFAFVPRSTISQPEMRVSLQCSSRQSQRNIKSAISVESYGTDGEVTKTGSRQEVLLGRTERYL